MNYIDALRNKTVAVSGASGYIGSQIVRILHDYGVRTIGIIRKVVESSSQFDYIEADIKDPDCWLEIVDKADVIFHLAGNTSVPAADQNPELSLETSLQPVNHLIEACRKLERRPRVIFASTATVYGLTSDLPVSEEVLPNPITIYDLHKLFTEQHLQLATNLGYLDAVSLRLANVYGPSPGHSSSADRGILNKLAALAIKTKKLSIYGSGEYLRDYVFIDDAVNAFIGAGACPNFGGIVLNIGSGIGTSVKQAFHLIALEVERRSGVKIEIENVPWPPSSNKIELRNYVASIEKIKSCLHLPTAKSLSEGIEKLVDSSIKSIS